MAAGAPKSVTPSLANSGANSPPRRCASRAQTRQSPTPLGSSNVIYRAPSTDVHDQITSLLDTGRLPGPWWKNGASR